MKKPRQHAAAWVVTAALASTAYAQVAPDPAAVERQYRVAQRLGADRSPDARAAFAKVVELAPDGPLADDALVDLARLSGLPDWPEEIAALDPDAAAAAIVPLQRVVADHADGDRADEALYRLALIRLAPLAGRDATLARRDLIALASRPSGSNWDVKARYTLGVLDEQSGATARAFGAFARIAIESAESDVAPRALAGLGRTLLVQGEFGLAAAWFQESIETGAPPALGAEAMRGFALREVLRLRAPELRWASIASPLSAMAAMRGASLLTSAVGGRLIVFDSKGDALQAFDAKGAASSPVSVVGVTALATDPFGRVFAATREHLLRLDGNRLTPILPLGRSASPAAMAVDASGTFWLADRKGDRVERWAPGMSAPSVVHERKGAGIASLAVSEGRVLAAEAKTGNVVVVAGPGSGVVFGTAIFRRPVSLAVDAAGRLSVLDEKTETVTRLTRSGDVSDTLSLRACGVSRPLALSFTVEGVLRVLDGSTGAVAVAP